MSGVEIVRSSTRTPSRLVSSLSHPAATTSGLRATAEECLTTVVAASPTISLGRTGASRLFSSRARRPQWTSIRDALAVGGLAADREGAAPPQPAPADPPAAATADPTTADAIPSAAAAISPPIAVPADRAPAPGYGTSRIELTIDSLRTYELVKPIPVFVEALGERHYVAEVPDLNITTSASSLSEILIVLKDSITQTYDELRIRRHQDPEQARQLKTLETYIGKSRRGWLERR
jgi:hypothetical protein